MDTTAPVETGITPMHQWFAAVPEKHTRVPDGPLRGFMDFINEQARTGWAFVMPPAATVTAQDLYRARAAMERNNVPQVTWRQPTFTERQADYDAMIRQLRADLDRLRQPVEFWGTTANTHQETITVGGNQVVATFRPTR